ncbi:MAG: transposase, partial [Crocosphaera sp.]
KPVLWSSSYCVISTGGAPDEVIKKYIQNQKSPQ